MVDQTFSKDYPHSYWTEQLKDEKNSKRDAALEKLGELKDPATIPEIGEVLLKDRNVNTRRSAVQSLAKIGVASVLPFLLKALENEKEPFIRRELVSVLGNLRASEAVSLLAKALDETDKSTQYLALDALSEINTPEAVNQIVQRLGAKREHPQILSQMITKLGKLRAKEAAPKIIEILKMSKDEVVARASVSALGNIQPEEGLPILVETLKNHTFLKVRIRAAEQLGAIGNARMIEPLCLTMLSDKSPELRSALVAALQKFPDWKAKTNIFLKIIKEGDYHRTDIPGVDIVSAIHPSEDVLREEPFVLTDYLLSNAVNLEEKASDNLAAVIIASTGGDQTRSAERINKFQNENPGFGPAMDQLRIQIGGETALDPVLQTLSDDLRVYFRIPIKELNDATLINWNKTIEYAQRGFQVRMIMSVIVFIVGIALLLVSSYQFMFGNLNITSLFGTGVSFVSGIGSILLIIYSGPLREIRQAIEDLGVSSASFIAYVHRVSQISHTFSFYYIKQMINFEELKKSSDLIQEAMIATIKQLEKGEKAPSENFINQVANQMKTGSKEKAGQGKANNAPGENETAKTSSKNGNLLS